MGTAMACRGTCQRGPGAVAGRVRTIAGRVCMDQIVLDCGDDDVRAGDIAMLFGPGDQGEPTADDWAAAAGTINYEIVTRIGGSRVLRHLTICRAFRRCRDPSSACEATEAGSNSRRRRAGLIGAVVGVAVAGVTAGVAAQRLIHSTGQDGGHRSRE